MRSHRLFYGRWPSRTHGNNAVTASLVLSGHEAIGGTTEAPAVATPVRQRFTRGVVWNLSTMRFTFLAFILGAALYFTNAAVVSLGASVVNSFVWWLATMPVIFLHVGAGYFAVGGPQSYRPGSGRAILGCLGASVVTTAMTTTVAVALALRFPLSLRSGQAFLLLVLSQVAALARSAFVVRGSRRSARRGRSRRRG